MKRLLVLLLFGMIAQAVDPIKIKDVNGIEFTLDDNQRNALKQCELIEPMLSFVNKDNLDDKNNVDFTKLARAFITQAHLQLLADIINDPKQIHKITDNNAVEMFLLADYVMAPKKVVRIFVERAEKLVGKQVAFLKKLPLLTEAQKAELDKLKTIQFTLEQYTVSINSLLKRVEDKKSLFTHIPERYEPWRSTTVPAEKELNLDYEKLQGIMPKKLTSVAGIEKLKDNWWDFKKVKRLNLSGHNIKKIDITQLKKLFPELEVLWLARNSIQEVTGPVSARNLDVVLWDNPLKLISISTPEDCNRLKFTVGHKQQDLKVEFPQSNISKIKTWIKSFAAKSKFVHHYLMPSFTRMCIYASIGILYKMVCINSKDAALLKDPNTMVLASDNQFSVLIDSPEQYEYWMSASKSDAEFFAKYDWAPVFFSKHTVAPLKEFLPTLLAESTQGFFGKWIVPCAQAAYKSIKNFTIAEWIGWIVVQGDYTDRNPITRYKSLEENNSYRVCVKKSVDEKISFPSNYTYKLFEKN